MDVQILQVGENLDVQILQKPQNMYAQVFLERPCFGKKRPIVHYPDDTTTRLELRSPKLILLNKIGTVELLQWITGSFKGS